MTAPYDRARRPGEIVSEADPFADFTTVEHPESVPVRDASTVALVRDTPAADGARPDSARPDGARPAGIEVFLMRRVPQMEFAAGMTVFPGGGVDPRDTDADIAWTGPEPAWWAQRFHAEPALAQALVCAAVRETFEECGVLLAGSSDGAVLADVADLQTARTELVDKTISLAAFLAENDLTLRADLLAPLAHWITPLGERRRYDTRFFVAALPPGQHADDRSSEAAAAGWHRVDDVLAAWRAGELYLLPPTWTQLDHIAGFATVADLLAAPREIVSVTPTLISDGSSVRIRFDGSERFHGDM